MAPDTDAEADAKSLFRSIARALIKDDQSPL